MCRQVVEDESGYEPLISQPKRLETLLILSSFAEVTRSTSTTPWWRWRKRLSRAFSLLAGPKGFRRCFRSITFRGVKERKELASSVLQDRHVHGRYDLWLVQNHEKVRLFKGGGVDLIRFNGFYMVSLYV